MPDWAGAAELVRAVADATPKVAPYVLAIVTAVGGIGVCDYRAPAGERMLTQSIERTAGPYDSPEWLR